MSATTCGGNDLLSVELSVQPHHLAEPRHVAQREVEAAAGEFDAGRIDREVRVLLDAELRPQTLAQKRADALAGHAAQHPPERVGVHRLVGEALPVRRGLRAAFGDTSRNDSGPW